MNWQYRCTLCMLIVQKQYFFGSIASLWYSLYIVQYTHIIYKYRFIDSLFIISLLYEYTFGIVALLSMHSSTYKHVLIYYKHCTNGYFALHFLCCLLSHLNWIKLNKNPTCICMYIWRWWYLCFNYHYVHYYFLRHQLIFRIF